MNKVTIQPGAVSSSPMSNSQTLWLKQCAPLTAYTSWKSCCMIAPASLIFRLLWSGTSLDICIRLFPGILVACICRNGRCCPVVYFRTLCNVCVDVMEAGIFSSSALHNLCKTKSCRWYRRVKSVERYSPVRVRCRSWLHTAQAIQVRPVLFLQRVLGVIPGVPLFDWMVRNRATGSIHTLLLVLVLRL